MREPGICLLGTGTAVPDPDRDFTHLVWTGPGGPILVDVGGGTYGRLLRAGIEPIDLTAIVLTHSHCDHINGLPALLFSLWLAGRRDVGNPIPIFGLASTLTTARNLVEAAELETVRAPVDWREIASGDAIPLATPDWTLITAPTRHSRPCLGLRWQGADGTAWAYSCDTEPCPEVDELVRGADLLIHEATTPGVFPSHTSPRQAGETAARAGAKRLVLVHFSPRWTLPEEDALSEVRAGGFYGSVSVGSDGEELRKDSEKN